MIISDKNAKWLHNGLGGHADPRHDKTASRGHVRRRKTFLAAPAHRALPLLPIRRAHGAFGRLRRSRGCLLRTAAGLDRTARQSAVGCTPREDYASRDGTTT